MNDVVIVSAKRTPFGKLLGAFANHSAIDLGATAANAAIEAAGIDRASIDAVLVGHVLQAGTGQNPARQTSRAANIPWEVPATAINKVCLSGLTAVIDAARLIRSGEAQLVLTVGQESMTNAPHLLPKARAGYKYGSREILDHADFDGLTDPYDKASMGVSTDKGNASRGIERGVQDEVALMSHTRAVAAAEAGIFTDEIVPISVRTRSGELSIDTDEGPRQDSSAEALAKLKPAFVEGGTVTAGNSSPLSDGASAVVVASRAYAEEHGLPILAVVGAAGQTAGPDNQLHSQPSRAIGQALDRAGLASGDLDFVEINEAFASVVVQSAADLDIPLEKVNLHGGAIALGHPIGASGNRLVAHAAHELARRGTGTAAVALCGGGGQGDALILYGPRGA